MINSLTNLGINFPFERNLLRKWLVCVKGFFYDFNNLMSSIKIMLRIHYFIYWYRWNLSFFHIRLLCNFSFRDTRFILYNSLTYVFVYSIQFSERTWRQSSKSILFYCTFPLFKWLFFLPFPLLLFLFSLLLLSASICGVSRFYNCVPSHRPFPRHSYWNAPRETFLPLFYSVWISIVAQMISAFVRPKAFTEKSSFRIFLAFSAAKFSARDVSLSSCDERFGSLLLPWQKSTTGSSVSRTSFTMIASKRAN